MEPHSHPRNEVPETTKTIISPVRPVRGATVDSRSAADQPRSRDHRPPRRRWPGVLAACILGAGIGALAVSNFYDERSVGERLDATLSATQETVQQTVQQGVDGLRAGATSAARDGVQVSGRAATALNDAGITAAVKTALAADPRLSAVKIDVDTRGGVVSLEGPAPDEKSRERAEVLAAAPEGVLRVDNRLVVAGPTQTVGR
ncbi:MAG TPA: BON domain-containing protein [Rubrivivax sp.]|nr:BON domain-containing protein [Rubrivivax sp.]